jgi:hypothetical protein
MSLEFFGGFDDNIVIVRIIDIEQVKNVFPYIL